ncbi:hypothetical protein Purlil1_11480 [Purpureocillium lilacinum]|uniref:tetrahydrofolate synthase n=1 Tax=Purpureocillium lilacinum TaxID=33203 RepID=A0ABR0BJG2_PURLI|nr:hypothetical protein Purlil1_11480 [Purpureocillium lilacinum]
MESNNQTYDNAVKVLQSRRRGQRPSVSSRLSDLPRSHLPRENQIFPGSPPIEGMGGWLQSLGDPHHRLSVIHVAGTKGKGSTAAWVELLLRSHGKTNGSPIKTGLYTSPHLIEVNERIRINFKPLRKEQFARYFFEVYERLFKPALPKPRYLQLMALLSFYTFASERVDVAVIETHHGGEFDATNIIANPVVTAITPIGLDHVLQLGPTIEDIAWHKGGIFKPGAKAFSGPQTSAVETELKRRAREKGVELAFVGCDETLPTHLPAEQRLNCSLAIKISNAFLASKRRPPLTADDILRGVREFHWPGRYQTVTVGRQHFFLDGAHNELSIGGAASWFEEASRAKQDSVMNASVVRIVIFSQLAEDRDSLSLISLMAQSLHTEIHHVFVTTHKQHYDVSMQDKDLLCAQAEKWKALGLGCKVWNVATIHEVFGRLKAVSEEAHACHILITGSLRLVAAALRVLRPNGDVCAVQGVPTTV